MSSPVTAAAHLGAVPATSVSCPDSGDKVVPEYLRTAVAALLANDLDQQTDISGKVAKAGDTMTGRLIVQPATTNHNAIEATGNGTGAAVTAAPGTAQTNTAPTRAIGASGYIELTGTDPAKGVNPGANDALHGANICKAWGTVSLTGGAPYATIDDYNVTNVTEPIANIYRINFVRPFANNTYAITFTPHSPSTGVSIASKNVAYCDFNVWDTTTGSVYTNRTVDFQAVGRQ